MTKLKQKLLQAIAEDQTVNKFINEIEDMETGFGLSFSLPEDANAETVSAFEKLELKDFYLGFKQAHLYVNSKISLFNEDGLSQTHFLAGEL